MARVLYTAAFKRYLTQLYHISKQYPFWNDLDTWPTGAIVWYATYPAPAPPTPQAQAYKALSTNTNVQPDTHPGTWEITPVRTQRVWRRHRSQRLPPGIHQPEYPYGPHHTTYDAELSTAYGNHRVIFLQLARAWQNGSGYPWAKTSFPSISIDYTAWNTIASTYLYQVRNNSYWPRNAFQWFMAYNLAAASVNGLYGFWNSPFHSGSFSYKWPPYSFGPYQYRITDNGQPLCFVGAPLPVYAPIQITAAKIFMGSGQTGNEVFVQPTPNLGAYLDSNNPPDPQDLPTLLISTGPTLPGGTPFSFKTRARSFEQPFWADDFAATADAYPVVTALLTRTSPTRRSSYLELRYIKNAAPWALDTFPVPCDAPGPPFHVRGATGIFSF